MKKKALITGITGQDGVYLHEPDRCFILRYIDMNDAARMECCRAAA